MKDRETEVREMEEKIIQLRRRLHDWPEPSGQEKKTKEILMDFLKMHTTLELIPCGDGFYGAHREEDTPEKKSSIALRADYDALALPDGTAAHRCGHDGHAAALCGVALFAEGKCFGRDVFFLFQPAEEIGAGAKECMELLKKESVGEIYGAHNLPGFPLGQVMTRPGTFACASRGVILKFQGKPAHAAYPEYGISPAPAVGQLLCSLEALTEPSRYTGMIMCTVIGVKMGEKAFGQAAAAAEVWLTLRGEHDTDLEQLQQELLMLSQTLAKRAGLSLSCQVQDVFPSTENTPVCAGKVLKRCHGTVLETPMRWSEDFGHYLKECPGAFFGIGSGEEQPPLHTENYEYPDELLLPTREAFLALLR